MKTQTSHPSIYDFQVKALDSEELIDLAAFRGKKLLIVNVASRCGFTPQYQGLQQLYEEYQDNLVVVGFPCNQFLFQESGNEAKIAEFCKTSYGVDFPMTSKLKVKGSGQHPIFTWLTSKEMNGLGNFKVSWNFNKFLIDENGKLLAHFPSLVKPMDHKILQYLN